MCGYLAWAWDWGFGVCVCVCVHTDLSAETMVGAEIYT
jgi:hypothetical protein